MLKVIHWNGAGYCWDVDWIVPALSIVVQFSAPTSDFENCIAQEHHSKHNFSSKSITMKMPYFTNLHCLYKIIYLKYVAEGSLIQNVMCHSRGSATFMSHILPLPDIIQAMVRRVPNTMLLKVKQETTKPSSRGRTDFQTNLKKNLSQEISMMVRR